MVQWITMPKGKTSSKECESCKKMISLFVYNRHVNVCRRQLKEKVPFTTGNCKFCQKEFTSKIGLGNHQVRCKENPDRRLQLLSDAGRLRKSISNRSREWSLEKREAHSKRMKLAVKNSPESYTSSNRGRTKQIEYKGIKFQGNWELEFFKWAECSGLNPIRATEGFQYYWNGFRTYFPDFYILSLDLYIEVKGYETDRDRAKWSQFPKKLRIIKESEIKLIRQGCFVGL